MTDPLFWHRLQFGFTITYHYLFPAAHDGAGAAHRRPEGASGCAPGRAAWNDAARFWIRIFGLSFAMGVVTGIPMEFQFGTNWAAFSRQTGGVIGQTLAMEGIFAFFLESSFLALLVWGERRLGPRGHFLAARSRSSSAAGSRATSSSRPTPSCSIRSGHELAPTDVFTLARSRGVRLQPLGDRAVPAQPDGGGGHRRVRDGRGRRLLDAARRASRTRRASRSRTGVIAGLVASILVAVPDRPRPGAPGRRAPAGRRSPRWRGASRAGRARRWR